VSSTDPSAPSLYLCGNSLGPLPKRTRELLHREIDVWGSRAVLGHFDHPHNEPWTKMEEIVVGLMSDVVGEYSFFLSVFLLYRSKSDLMLFPLLLL